MFNYELAISSRAQIVYQPSQVQNKIYCHTEFYLNSHRIIEDVELNYCKNEKKFESSSPVHHISTSNPLTYTPYSPLHSLINYVENSTHYKKPETPVLYSVSEDLGREKNVSICANSPLFHHVDFTIKIPSKVEYALKRHVPSKSLRQIHPDKAVAIELCLLFISQLTITYFKWKDGSNPEGWKALKAAYLRELLAYEHNTYKKIRELLETPLMNGPIIECDYLEVIGEKCFNYRLTSEYIGKGIKIYELKTPFVRDLKIKYHFKRLKEAQKNVICKNLLELYSKITLPTVEEIKQQAQKLIKAGYKSKKGKLLTFQHKHKKEYFSNASDRTFVEDAIEAFNFLTSGTIMMPTISSEYAGGRVVDSFVLMPSFIRNMCKIEEDPIAEVDYTCFHPNIAMSLYGGKQKYLTHQFVAERLNIPVSVVKTEHLSFFNKHPKEMQKSPIYHYYQETEPEMMKNLIKEKYATSRKYKFTSQKMFEMEVQIMTDAIKQLSYEGINVIYVYDALLCKPEHANRVKQVMDEQVIKHGVFTSAKITMPST